MPDSSEALNNAIRAAATVAGQGTPAWRLNDDWQEYYTGSFWRGLGPLGDAFTAGTEAGFHRRYADVWRRLTKEQRARVPRPATVKPDPLSDAQQSVVDANRDVVRAAEQAARKGASELKQTVQDIAEGTLKRTLDTYAIVGAAIAAVLAWKYLK